MSKSPIKVLYGLPAVGNGHLARARHILPLLKKFADVDILTAGHGGQVELPYPIMYKKKGLSLHYTHTWGISIAQTVLEANIFKVIQDIATLPVEQYDFVISDFEPVTARAAKYRQIPCIHLGHQASFSSPKTPRPPTKNLFIEMLFSDVYIPHKKAIGFHFEAYDTFIHTPVIREEIRKQKPSNRWHIVVYLQTYDDAILIKEFAKFPKQKFEISSKFAAHLSHHDNVTIYPVNNERFVESLASSAGLITGGGFEWPAEAIFLGKKLLCIPQIAQYEQACNVAALKKLGIMSIERIDDTFSVSLEKRFDEYKPIHKDYPDETESIIARIFA